MKKSLLLFVGVFISAQLFAADSIRFAEKLTDKLVTTSDPYFGSYSEVETTISGTFNATVTFPGLSSADFDSDTELSFSIGGVYISSVGEEADVVTANSLTFYQTMDVENNDGGFTTKRVGTVTFSRNGNVLTVAAQSSDLDGLSFAAQDYAGDPGSINDQIEAHIQIGEFEMTRNVYFKGTSTVTHRIIGSGDDAEDFDLNSVTLSGEADTTPPTVSITMPKANQRWSNEVFTVSGKAADSSGVQSVMLRVNDDEPEEVDLVNGNWMREISLVPGLNVIKAYATDSEENESIPVTVKMTYVLTAPLTVSTTGSGAVTPNYNGQLLELGKNYTMTAAPTARSGFVFTNWTGSLPTNKAALTFTMVSNLVLTANFVDVQKPVLTIVDPKANARISNAVFTVSGKASDNAGVTSVRYQLNGGEWNLATVTESNWSAQVTLTPGLNVIKAYATDSVGNNSTTGAVSFTYVVSDNLNLTVDAGGKVTGVSNQQLLELGKTYKATAVVSNNFLFAGWAGDISSTNLTLSFMMVSNRSLHAKFIPNPFLPIKGVFNGLFFPGNSNAIRSEITTDAVTSSNAGFFTLTLTDRGAGSGKALLGGAMLPFSKVQFDLAGHAHFDIVRPGATPDLTADLQIDFQAKTLTGTVQSKDNSFTAQVVADFASGNATFFAKHTFVIPGGFAADTNAPVGDGAGKVDVSNKGVAALTGSLGDGSPIAQSVSLSSGGNWPIYISLQGGRGVLIGWASFTTNPQPYHVISTHLRWIKSPAVNVRDKMYRAGFNQEKEFTGAKYIAPPTRPNVLDWSNGIVLIDGEALPVTISNNVTVANNKVTVLANSNSIVVTLTPSTGLVTGSFKPTGSTIARAIKGAIIQLPSEAGGSFIGSWFLGTNQSGYLFLKREEIPAGAF